MNAADFASTLNQWGQQRVPFLFIADFELLHPFVIPLDEVDQNMIKYDFDGFSNDSRRVAGRQVQLQKMPPSFDEYKVRFDTVHGHLKRGDSFLTNLTMRTKIHLNYTLEEVYRASRARYRLYCKDKFVVFSPESFVQVREGKIFSYPMKGTIDSAVQNARDVILADKKELSEHITIVDLIRNDLSRVAVDVGVTRFRYVEELRTHDKTLLQVSSEISGTLTADYRARIGDILTSLLPAGSISGAPKQKTVEIIHQVEGIARGYYTGVCGYFDGDTLNSAVMIRYIEKEGDLFYYRSGGGITALSSAESEYKEAIEKIYVPID